MNLGKGKQNFGEFLKRWEAKALLFFVIFLVAAFMIDVMFLPSLSMIVISGGLFLLAIVVAATALYRTTPPGSSASVEPNELQAILETMEDALLVYDENFRVLFFNPAAETLFHVSKQQILGEKLEASRAGDPDFRLLIQVVFPSLAPVMVSRSESGSPSQVVDLSFSDPSLELRTITSRVQSEEGKEIGFMKLIRNRTREISLLKSKSEFISVASHQLRTPITHINFALESLAKNLQLNSESQVLFDNALVSARELNAIVDDLLSVSKIEEGKFGYQFVETDLVAFLEKTLEEVAPQARAVGIKLFFDRPKEPVPNLLIDPQKLTMAISNLLDNSIRYNVPNGEVTVAIAPKSDDKYVEILLSDTGIGIPPEEVPKLFQKFYRATNATKFSTEGSGLGLYIVQNIVRAHGGKVWVESELNRGTIFHIALPLDQSLVPQHEAGVEY